MPSRRVQDAIRAAVLKERRACARLARKPHILAFGPVSKEQISAMAKLTNDELLALCDTFGKFAAAVIKDRR